jgi:hypothetical protein
LLSCSYYIMSKHVVQKSTTKVFTLEEVAKHVTEESKYLVIDGNVFDVTEFVNEVCCCFWVAPTLISCSTPAVLRLCSSSKVLLNSV